MLCDLCANLDLDQASSRKGYTHHSSFKALLVSAQNGCEFCDIIVNSSQQDNDAILHMEQEFQNTEIACKFVHDSSLLFAQKGVFGIGGLYSTISVFVPTGMNNFTEPQLFDNLIYFMLDSPAAFLVGGRPVCPTSASESCFGLVSAWLQRCLSTHQICSHNIQNALPTRVIDVGQPNTNQEPHLLVSEGRHGDWVTLSHCWGTTSQPLRTTTDNLEEHRRGLPVSELPLTFRDAITITRQLGYRYIWIDSICILQNSGEDWLFESTRMQYVYKNAIFNIAAEASRGPKDGIFDSANGLRKVAVSSVEIPYVMPQKDLKGTMFVRKNTPLRGDRFLLGPLSERAWVLQETILSPRIIRYSKEQLTWTCLSTHCNEQFPTTHTYYQHPLQSTSNREIEGVLGQVGRKDEGRRLLTWWYQTVNDFCHRKLTYMSDKFQAISAVALGVQIQTGYQYKAGIWLQNVHRGLLWSASERGERTSEYIAPSWSWASLKFTNDLRQTGPYSIRTGRGRMEEEALVEKIHLLYKSADDEFGQLSSGYAIIRGQWRGFGHWQDMPPPHFNSGGKESILHSAKHTASTMVPVGIALPGQIVCSLDCALESQGAKLHLSSKEIIYMKIARIFGAYDIGVRSTGIVHGLILEKVEGNSDEFQRIGIAQIPGDFGMTEGWPTRTVKII